MIGESQASSPRFFATSVFVSLSITSTAAIMPGAYRLNIDSAPLSKDKMSFKNPHCIQLETGK